jgi:hypothetical protein
MLKWDQNYKADFFAFKKIEIYISQIVALELGL